jgi:virginiamycin B lyase
VWFVNAGSNKLGHINKTGAVTLATIPGSKNNPVGITTGSDGAVWFTESATNKIGRVTAGPTFSSFAVPAAEGTSPRGITAGPGGFLYFVTNAQSRVVKFDVHTHAFTLLAQLPAGTGPTRIAAGADGNLWVSGTSKNDVFRVTPASVQTRVALAGSASPARITSGPDQNIWVAEPGINHIAKITTAATPVVTQFSVPGKPTGITSGPDGNLYVTEQGSNMIARVSTAGVVKSFAIPTKGSSPGGIVTGSDGNTWFSENVGNKIGRLTSVQGHSSYVVVHDNGFVPSQQGIALETGTKKTPTTVRWVFATGEPHSVADTSGMGLFSSGSQAPGSSFAHTFTTAGTFAYNSNVGTAFAGTPQIKVTPAAAVTGGHTTITVTIATTVPAGVTMDVQVALPGSSTFNPAPAGTGLTTLTYTYTPTNGTGVYKFQVRTNMGGNSSSFSPAARATF